MALSDYLTGDEWDACFYVSLGKHAAPNFGESMHKTVDVLLAKGYKFPGLTEDGRKTVQVENGVNAPKIVAMLFGGDGVDFLSIADNGRKFLMQHCPELVSETDAEWAAVIEEIQSDRQTET